MKVRFNREEMAEALAAVCQVASGRTPKPILQCVYLEAKPDVVFLSATDMELSLRCAVTQVEVDEPGETVVVADTLGRIVRECPDELLTIRTENNLLQLRGVGSHFQIVTQDAEAFPPVPIMDVEPDFVVEHAVLRRLMEWTVFAAARESSRYAINGVLFEAEGDRLTLVATDGRRLAYARGALLSPPAQGMLKAVVPGKALSLFARLPGEDDARVGVKITSNQLLLKTGRAMISTSLVEGQFPSYRDVIPNDCDRVVTLATSEFQSALKRAALLTNEESKGVRLSLAPGEMTLSSRAPEQGEATLSMPVGYRGEPMEIGFNPVFLLDLLRVVHADEMAFAFRDAQRPGLARIGDDFVHVVMPVSLSSA